MANEAKISKDLKKEVERLYKEAIKKVTKADLDSIGKTAVDSMKELISQGISPIQGKGRFPAYKHAGDPTKYPDNKRKKFPDKRARPVNLKLSGEFLRNLIFKSNAANKSVQIGFFDKKNLAKEQGHRDGANDQPERPVIPTGRENLAQSILLQMEKVVQNILKKIKL